MRYLVVDRFAAWIKHENFKLSRVAVVGGSSSDPEILELKKVFPDIDVYVFGIENSMGDPNFELLDLNSDTIQKPYNFDLILCSQVLEHVWNLENSFKCLAKLSKPGTYLWLNCPTSNIPHGSPNYFSAGYTSDFLANNLELKNFDILFKLNLGSKRNYFITHALRQWVSRREHNHPILGYHIKPGTFLGISKKLLKEMPGRFISLFYSKEILEGADFATESIVLARFKESSRP